MLCEEIKAAVQRLNSRPVSYDGETQLGKDKKKKKMHTETHTLSCSLAIFVCRVPMRAEELLSDGSGATHL